MTEKIGKKVKRAMQDADLNQAELGKKLGVTRQLISSWITGAANPKVSSLEKIAKATGKPLNYFFDNSTNTNGHSNIIAHGGGIIMNNKDPLAEKEIDLLKKDIALLRKEVENLSLKFELFKKEK